MDTHLKITIPRYQQIAADIASKIAAETYKVGDKIYARSSLASQYGVSAETARRAICVLADLKIVETSKGSGVIITSYEEAVKFIRQYEDVQTITHLKEDIHQSVERQKKEIEYFYGRLSDLIDKTDRLRSVNPFVPFQIEITRFTPYLNRSVADINFWHNTLATIIAIKRQQDMLMSPGPYAILSEKDILYFVGDDDCLERVKKYLYPKY